MELHSASLQDLFSLNEYRGHPGSFQQLLLEPRLLQLVLQDGHSEAAELGQQGELLLLTSPGYSVVTVLVQWILHALHSLHGLQCLQGLQGLSTGHHRC